MVICKHKWHNFGKDEQVQRFSLVITTSNINATLKTFDDGLTRIFNFDYLFMGSCVLMKGIDYEQMKEACTVVMEETDAKIQFKSRKDRPDTKCRQCHPELFVDEDDE